MPFDGWLELGGKEIINVARTEAYINSFVPSLGFQFGIDCGSLTSFLGDAPYVSPVVDDAPWYDPNQPETGNFYGFYPLEVTGVGDSTRSADVIESIDNGGTVGEARYGTRAMRYRGFLVSKTPLAMEEGMAWLRATLANDCGGGPGSCGGAQMCFFAACPAYSFDVNASENPRAIAGTGWTGAGANQTQDDSVSIPGHPLGITTALRGRATNNNAQPIIMSARNIEGVASAPAYPRQLGAWVYVTAPGYEVVNFAGFPMAGNQPLAADTWTYVKTLTPVAAGVTSDVQVRRTTGNAPNTVYAYVTGAMVKDATVDTTPVGDYLDGNLPDTVDDDGVPTEYAWLGTPLLSASTRTYGYEPTVWERYLHDVACIEGPTILRDMPTQSGCEGYMREVAFTLVAGLPHIYAATTEFMPPTVLNSLPSGYWRILDDCADDGGYVIVDPECDPVPAPPRPPLIANGCAPDLISGRRFWLAIPPESASSWSSILPTFRFWSGGSEVRQVRVRIYADPFNRGVDSVIMNENRALNGGSILDATYWNLHGTGTFTGRQFTGGPPRNGLFTDIPFIRFTTTGAQTALNFGGNYGTPTGGMPMTVSSQVFPSIWARTSVANRDLRATLYFYTAAGVQVGSGVVIGTIADTGPANTWQRMVNLSGGEPVKVTVPGTAAYGQIRVTGDSASWTAAGQTLDLAQAHIDYKGLYQPYWDGSSVVPPGGKPEGQFYWVDELANSISIQQYAPVDECDFCSEFIISYMPFETEYRVDGVFRETIAGVAGIAEPQNVSNLMYGANGGPMVWPELTCGIAYMVAIDVSSTLISEVTLGIELTRREEA